jgi:hypothetical protein
MENRKDNIHATAIIIQLAENVKPLLSKKLTITNDTPKSITAPSNKILGG